MNNSQTLGTQPQSLGKYIEDIWIVALFFVIVQQQTTISLPFLWIALQLLIVVMMQIVGRKFGGSQLVTILIPAVLLIPLISGSIWLYLVSVVFSMWRLDARFKRLQEEQTLGSNFLLFFFLSFVGVYLFLLSNNKDYLTFLYVVFVSGILVFCILRLIAVWSAADRTNTISKKMLALWIGIGILVVSISSFLVYSLFPFVREGIGFLLEGFLTVLMFIVGPPMQSLIEYIQSNAIDPATIINSTEPGEQLEEQQEPLSYEKPGGFAYVKWLLVAIGATGIAGVVYFLLKKKPEFFVRAENPITYENSAYNPEQENESNGQRSNSLYAIESSYLREQYSKFETEAVHYELERRKNETVREWFRRMAWEVKPAFYDIYEEVRYGGASIDENKAKIFLETLEKIKNNNFFKKDV